MHYQKSIFWSFLLGLSVSGTALARIVQPVTQPIGTLVRTYETTGALPFPTQPPPPHNQPFPQPVTPIEEMNYICAQWDDEEIPATAPFDINYPATEIILTQPQHFVRLLGTPKSGSNGAWIMRSEYVRGRTPDELRDIFALPDPPIAIVNVEMPASPDPATGKNYALWTGIAGPIRGPGHDWGDGGSVQNRLVSDFNGTHYFPTYRFTSSDTRNHRQPIGAYALSYKPLAGSGNTYSLASYLDTYIPQAYSDLENVYTALDYLNFIDFGPMPLRNALCQITPERYDTLSFVAFRNALLISESILEWQIDRQWQNRWLPCIPEHQHASKPTLWIQSISEFNSGVPVGGCCCNNFRYHNSGLVACLDWQVRPSIILGITAAGLGNSITWCDHRGKAHSGNTKIGFYANYFRQNFFIDGLISGGGNWTSANRHIEFYGVNRTAYSHPKGEDIEVQMQGGLTLVQWLVPSARLFYCYNHENKFTECGADSLNLMVHGYNTHTMRLHLGLDMNHVFEGQHANVMPHVQLAWAHDFFLRPHILAAQLCGPNGCFSVCGMHTPSSFFVGSASLNIMFNNCCSLLARYDVQARSKYVIQDFKLGLQVSF